MSTLSARYAECCYSLNWTPRNLISSALSEFEELYDKNGSATCFLQLPTGYGKSTVTLALGKDAINGSKFGQRVIHVLPLRSIIYDLQNRLQDWFRKLQLNPDRISGQYMGSAGSPFFANKVVITTLDTFSMNFFKIPAVEASKAFRTGNSHFETARGFIYSSVVIFDEAHLFALDQGEYRQVFTVFVSCLRQLAAAGIPLLIITATLPRPIRQFLKEMYKDRGIALVDREYEHQMDPVFEASFGKRSITTDILSTDDEASKVINDNPDKKILIIVNEVNRAIQFYQTLKTYDPVLLHGKMTEKDRKDNVRRMYEPRRKKWIIIGTQVVEAGLDINADILISDLAPMDRLIQRAGRVARSGGKGRVYILENYSKVYDENDLKTSKSLVQRHASEIDWALDAQRFVDAAYANFEPRKMIDENLSRYLTNIDESLMYGIGNMLSLIGAIKSFPRETSLVKAYSPQSFDHGDLVERDGYIAVSSLQATAILQNSKKAVKNGGVVIISDDDLRKIFARRDLPLSMVLEMQGFDGIVLDKYQSGVGYI